MRAWAHLASLKNARVVAFQIALIQQNVRARRPRPVPNLPLRTPELCRARRSLGALATALATGRTKGWGPPAVMEPAGFKSLQPLDRSQSLCFPIDGQGHPVRHQGDHACRDIGRQNKAR